MNCADEARRRFKSAGRRQFPQAPLQDHVTVVIKIFALFPHGLRKDLMGYRDKRDGRDVKGFLVFPANGQTKIALPRKGTRSLQTREKPSGFKKAHTWRDGRKRSLHSGAPLRTLGNHTAYHQIPFMLKSHARWLLKPSLEERSVVRDTSPLLLLLLHNIRPRLGVRIDIWSSGSALGQ